MSKKTEGTIASNDVTKQENREKRQPVIYLGPPVRMAGIPVHLATNQTWTDRPKLPGQLQFLFPFFVPPIEAFKKTRKTLKEQWPEALEKLAVIASGKEE